MNTAEVIDRLRENPRQIKVKCPNNHFIANITLSVRDDQLTTRWGLSGNELRRRRLEGKPALYADVVAEDDRNVELKCRSSHCDYNPTRNAQLLALELAEAALRGHAVHRLTW